MIRVYRYGARLTSQRELVEDQLHHAHRFRNLLLSLKLSMVAAKRATVEPYTRDEVAAARDAAKEDVEAAWEAVKQAAKAASEGPARADLDAITARYKDICKRAYNASPAAWGTKLLISQFIEKAKKFRRWAGEGMVGVQIQHGIAPSALRDDRRVQLHVTPQAAANQC
jgi:hypothetical protein